MKKILTSFVVISAVAIGGAYAEDCVPKNTPFPNSNGSALSQWFRDNCFVDGAGNWKGDPGQDGTHGKSAYELWKEIPGNESKSMQDMFDSLQGPQGAEGPQGAQGARGARGPQGFQGDKGATGAQGAQGAQGARGARGFQGAQGAQGNQGEKGEDFDKSALDAIERLENLLMGRSHGGDDLHDHVSDGQTHADLEAHVQDKFAKAEGSFQRDNIKTIDDADFDIVDWANKILGSNGGSIAGMISNGRASSGISATAAEDVTATDGTTLAVYDTNTIDTMFSLIAATSSDSFASLDNRINNMTKELSAGIASATALTGIDNHLDKSSRYSVGIGGGNYNGQSSVAMGAVVRTSFSSALNFGLAIDTYQAKPAVRVGWNIQW